MSSQVHRCYVHFERCCSEKLQLEYQRLDATPLESSPAQFFRGPWTARRILLLPVAAIFALFVLPSYYLDWKSRKTAKKQILEKLLGVQERARMRREVTCLQDLWNATVRTSEHTFYRDEARELLVLFVTEVYGPSVAARLDLAIIGRTLESEERLTNDVLEDAGIHARMGPQIDRIVSHLNSILPPFDRQGAAADAESALERRRYFRNY